MPIAVDRSMWEAELKRLGDLMTRLHARAAIGSRALGVPEWDWQLSRIGREWLAARADSQPQLQSNDHEPGYARRPDVYLATQVYDLGGHTALIGDFVRALDGTPTAGEQAGASSTLILTDLYELNSVPVSEAIQARLVLPASRITILRGPSLADRLDQLFAELLRLNAGRLFLFHHPQDPLASVVAQPEVARQRILVHHADSTPSFAMHLPGVRIVDLTPMGAAMTRLLGRTPACLLLTAPDPGPRPRTFLTRGRLVTATCGSAHKFSTPYVFRYAETVGVILRTTGGWHVHIGPLETTTCEQIDDVLRRAHLPRDRFVHVPWTASVASTLWEQACDVYCASFPIDGARTRVEVLASATPYVRHSTSPDVDPTHPDAADDGGLVWRDWDDLSAVLQRMADVGRLEESAARMRREYDTMHHPDVFSRTIAEILDGGCGVVDPHRAAHAERAMASTMRSLTSALVHDTGE